MKKTLKKMKNAFKKFFGRIDELIVWYSSKRVLNAINNGATYEDVCKIVEEEVNK